MRVLKFGIVGIANTALDFSVFCALVWGAGLAPAIANIVSYSCGIALSFWLNRAWTFRDRVIRDPAASLTVFAAGSLAGLAISTAVVAWLSREWGPLPAKVVSVGASFAWNFAFSNLIVFRRRSLHHS